MESGSFVKIKIQCIFVAHIRARGLEKFTWNIHCVIKVKIFCINRALGNFLFFVCNPKTAPQDIRASREVGISSNQKFHFCLIKAVFFYLPAEAYCSSLFESAGFRLVVQKFFSLHHIPKENKYLVVNLLNACTLGNWNSSHIESLFNQPSNKFFEDCMLTKTSNCFGDFVIHSFLAIIGNNLYLKIVLPSVSQAVRLLCQLFSMN